MVRPLWLGDDIGALAGARGRVLSVLQVGYPFAPVTADPAGGAEQVLAMLDRAVVAAGHRSLVIAPAGSRVAGELIAIPPARGAIDEAARARTHAAVRAAMAAALPRADVVHLHGIDFGSYAPPAMSAPVLATLHLPMPWYPPAALTGAAHLLPVSAVQAATAPPGVRLLPPIDNGVDLASFASVFARRAYVTCIGRVAPEKGFADAIDAAVLAGVPLLLAGVVFPYPDHRRYFDEAIRPRLSRTVRWLGPVTGRAKRRLIGGARALLNPSRAAETSSLVAMEAAAAGTPVIAYRSGALPHVVEHGRTGFIVDGGDVAGMAAAIREVDAIDPAVCRATAARRFDARRTAAAYLDLYAALASGSVTPAAAR